MSPKNILVVFFAISFPVSSVAVIGDPERISGWVKVYRHDSSGSAQEGSKAILVSAIKSGADIKVTLGSSVAFKICSDVSISQINNKEEVYCNTTSSMALVGSTNPISLRSDPYWAHWAISTLGRYGLVRVSIYTHNNLGQSHGAIAITWWARVK